MTGGGGGKRRRAAYAAAAAALLVLAGCSTPPHETGTQGVRRLLERWAAAVRDKNENAYLDAVDPAADRYRAERRRVYANLAALPLATWEYRLKSLKGTTAEAQLRYRIAGYGGTTATVPVRLTVARHGERWYVTGQDATRAGNQLWEQGTLTAVHGTSTLVLGVDQDRGRLKDLADLADRAVPAVTAAWPGPWPRRVVVELPATLDRMAALLDSPPSKYRGIAAVTTEDRIVVNPEAYAELGDFGRRVVLTHETTHAATRDATTRSTPMWLSEGFADWVAYRGTARTPRQIAPELAGTVAGGAPPDRLPPDTDFAFTGDAGRLARAYEGGWLACRLIAERWGEERLVAAYRAAGRGGLWGALGVSEAAFTAQWREYVAEAF
ncbi:hypothetical protein [Streptomyces sp. NPDC049555]|uniref:hypothetical protein n=1 Tax=unclassified Streptomyces TaxID=2593676 RepID=UPI003434135E